MAKMFRYRFCMTVISASAIAASICSLWTCSRADMTPFPLPSPAHSPPVKAWLSKPIPLRLQTAPTALDYHSVPFAELENMLAREPLVELSNYGLAGESYYARTDGLNPPYYKAIPLAERKLYCRRTVAEKLRSVNESLKPYGVELFVMDAWRPVEVQRSLWQFFLDQARSKLHTNNAQSLKQYAGKFCSNPQDFNSEDEHTWPTHVTGGAVDLTLRRLNNGEFLFMGGVFDDASDVSYTDFFERRAGKPTDARASRSVVASSSDIDACRNRRLLYWSMKNADFANYSYEWWHFDFGNQMWAKNPPASPAMVPRKAFYGVTPQP
jgi:D-alanyl-D-alanine dipeptidase